MERFLHKKHEVGFPLSLEHTIPVGEEKRLAVFTEAPCQDRLLRWIRYSPERRDPRIGTKKMFLPIIRAEEPVGQPGVVLQDKVVSPHT